MAKTYASEMKDGVSCETPYCGLIYKYFCVKCCHYLLDCRCTPGGCECGIREYWASKGERKFLRKKLAENYNQPKKTVDCAGIPEFYYPGMRRIWI